MIISKLKNPKNLPITTSKNEVCCLPKSTFKCHKSSKLRLSTHVWKNATVSSMTNWRNFWQAPNMFKMLPRTFSAKFVHYYFSDCRKYATQSTAQIAVTQKTIQIPKSNYRVNWSNDSRVTWYCWILWGTKNLEHSTVIPA